MSMFKTPKGFRKEPPKEDIQELCINNVDFELLKKQHEALNDALYGAGIETQETFDLLQGLLNMLDTWSDANL